MPFPDPYSGAYKWLEALEKQVGKQVCTWLRAGCLGLGGLGCRFYPALCWLLLQLVTSCWEAQQTCPCMP